ncbi:5-deoxy-glucuronate isomerase [Parasphaerochaeta coccoides]|uniref:Myo-inositol catabolism IolB domain protein n=1 Tax=Parasphaerochaeta coccoides (strain ATCC BAA-1237 / DSM 17374 / SPN1) TaxID=760011 RepID=F4GJ30_PARC1|nr:5-deoxy-glucuronate isomerase [Parasphaerochaeta coccoides]AEC01325.1 myo-inositol catabolism IolB domain protein [Parasphaerochaeta coccoides DSM 17374]
MTTQMRHSGPYVHGYTDLVPGTGPTSDMFMSFGVLSLKEGDTWTDTGRVSGEERVWLLAQGNAKISWGKERLSISRPDLFDHEPWVLSVPSAVDVSIVAGKGGAEFYRSATDNPLQFASRLFTPEECRSEFRGEGMMNETSTRIVRTVFDDTNRPESNLVIGEVIGVPGKWSSYPPHHHPQPEIYHYRFLPGQGFGFCAIGETPCLIKDRDTILIHDHEVHPHVTAPGYAMWYIWIIRHIEGNRYAVQHVPPQYQWVTESGAEIWAPKKK